MNVRTILLMIGYLSIVSSLPTNEVLKSNPVNSIQIKRDLSLSYAATDIGSKEGTRVKTITVIKNIVGKKDKPIQIDPKLHKNENWGSHFRDNFNTYGVIPDIPDIDDLFEFVNKKDEIPKEKDNPQPEVPDEQDKNTKGDEESKKEEEATTTSSPAPVEEVPNESTEEKVEKIVGDAEIIQPGGKQGKVKSESLDLGKYSIQETMLDVNYSSPQHSVRQYTSNSGASSNKNEKYIQQASAPYYYPQPSRANPNAFSTGYSPQSKSDRGSVTLTTPFGKTFDVPFINATDVPPYIAPTFRRNEHPPPGQQIVSSSQRPYIAPNVRKSYEVQLNNTSAVSNNNVTSPRQQPAINVYKSIPISFRTSNFSGYKPNMPRSRGLRY